MRPIYACLKTILPLLYFTFFRRRKLVNAPKKFKAQTIFVSNHPSAFLDPPMIATLHRPIVFFMTRSDVFKAWLKPVTWASHMVPIYRAAQDGDGTYEKNQQIFAGIRKVLKQKKSLIMFGEGYTDDVFIRSLKPMKKGPPRIGFGAMDATDWKEDIKIQAVGVNYSDPGKFRSHVLISYGDPIHLSEYKELYDENPNKATLQLMRRIGNEIKENITYIEDKKKADFLEHILILTRKGNNYRYFDSQYSLKERVDFSKAVANKINSEYTEGEVNWENLEKNTNNYFKDLESKNIDEDFVHTYSKSGSKGLVLKWLYLLLTFPLFVLGTVHTAVPYLIVKTMIEKMFKRRVFWSGVKLMLGALFAFLFNLPVFWLAKSFLWTPLEIDPTVGFFISLFYFAFIIPVIFIFWHNWKRKFAAAIQLGKVSTEDLKTYSEKRANLLKEISSMGI